MESRWPPYARRGVTRAQTGAGGRAVLAFRDARCGQADPSLGRVPRYSLPRRAVPSPPRDRPPRLPERGTTPRRGRTAPALPGEGLPGGVSRAAGPPQLTSSPSPRCTLSGATLPWPGRTAPAHRLPLPRAAGRRPPPAQPHPQRLPRAPPLPPLRQWPRPPATRSPGPQLTARQDPPRHSREPPRTPEPGCPPGGTRTAPARGMSGLVVLIPCSRAFSWTAPPTAPLAARGSPSWQSGPSPACCGVLNYSRPSPHAGRAVTLQFGAERGSQIDSKIDQIWARAQSPHTCLFSLCLTCRSKTQRGTLNFLMNL